MISLIAAVSENNVIGNKGKIPWHLPRDFKHFKETTMGHPIVMGRKTHESIGKPLPGRENIILTRQEDYVKKGCLTVTTIDDILKRKEDIFVIGGSAIYKQFLPHAKKVFLTRVHTIAEGDSFFPTLSEKKWILTNSEYVSKDKKNEFDMTFEIYKQMGEVV